MRENVEKATKATKCDTYLRKYVFLCLSSVSLVELCENYAVY